MNKQEILQAIQKAEKQLAVSKEQDERDFAQRKIDKLTLQLSDIEAKEVAQKDMGLKKVKPKSKLGKSVKEIIEQEQVESIPIIDTEKQYKYDSKVIKHSDEHYVILYKGDTTKDAEIKLNSEGYWELICKEERNYPKFKRSQVEMAINFVLEVKDCIHSRTNRLEQAKNRKKIREKYEKLSDAKKAENAVEKAAESVENRIEEIKDEGKEVTFKQAKEATKGIISQIKAYHDGLKDAERKRYIQACITELKKLM